MYGKEVKCKTCGRRHLTKYHDQAEALFAARKAARNAAGNAADAEGYESDMESVCAETSFASMAAVNALKAEMHTLKAEVQALEQEVSDLDSILDGYINILTGDQTPVSPTPVQAPAPVQEGKSDADKG